MHVLARENVKLSLIRKRQLSSKIIFQVFHFQWFKIEKVDYIYYESKKKR